MGIKKISDKDFIEMWQKTPSVAAIAQQTGMNERSLHKRRSRIEAAHRIKLPSPDSRSPSFVRRLHSPRMTCEMQSGVIIVGSDAHYWPGVISPAHQAFVQLIKDLKPEVVVLNGDLFDGARISRHPRSDWSAMPTVKEELQAVSDRFCEIKQAAGGAKLIWCMGNHDMRFESKLANSVPEYEGVPGFALQDHFPEALMTMSFFVNQHLMIKHRYHNGVHATFNNTLKSGVSMCTGHLHRLQATIFSDYNGNRWGIDCGTLAPIDGDHMHYGEDNPMNHCSGFAVLTLIDGNLLHPEFCSVVGEHAYFRGQRVI